MEPINKYKNQIVNRKEGGLWIPEEIMHNADLSVQEKMILSKIYHLDNDKEGCFANNRYFSDYFGLSRTRISKIINGLARKGHIVVDLNKPGGYNRKIKSLLKERVKADQGNDNSSSPAHQRPFDVTFKHNKEINKEEKKEKMRENEKKALTHFDFLSNNYPDEIESIKLSYRMITKQWDFCVHKFNEKSYRNVQVMDFENYVSNWYGNLKENDKWPDLRLPDSFR